MLKYLICAGLGAIIGSATTVIAILFMMAARPDTPQKRMEDWRGLQEYVRGKKEKKDGFTEYLRNRRWLV